MKSIERDQLVLNSFLLDIAWIIDRLSLKQEEKNLVREKGESE